MALPISRNFTYAPNDPVRSADLNDIQDQIIAFHGEKTIVIPFSDFVNTNDSAGDFDFNDAGIAVRTPGAVTTLICGFALPLGAQLRSVKLSMPSKSAAANCSLFARNRPSGGPNGALGSDVRTTAGDFAIDLTSSPYTVIVDEQVFVILEVPKRRRRFRLHAYRCGKLVIIPLITSQRPNVSKSSEQPLIEDPPISFDIGGAGGAFSRTPASGLFELSPPFTLECWANIQTYPANHPLMSRWFFPNQLAYFFHINSAGHLGIIFTPDGTAQTIYSAGTVVMPTGWQHLAIASDATSTRFLRNGILITTPSPGIAALYQSSTSDFAIGADGNYSVGWSDEISQPRVWSVKRSDAEILANHDKIIKSHPDLIESWPTGTAGLEGGYDLSSVGGAAVVGSPVPPPFQ